MGPDPMTGALKIGTKLDTDVHVHRGRPCDVTAGRRPSTSQGARPQKEQPPRPQIADPQAPDRRPPASRPRGDTLPWDPVMTAQQTQSPSHQYTSTRHLLSDSPFERCSIPVALVTCPPSCSLEGAGLLSGLPASGCASEPLSTGSEGCIYHQANA